MNHKFQRAASVSNKLGLDHHRINNNHPKAMFNNSNIINEHEREIYNHNSLRNKKISLTLPTTEDIISITIEPQIEIQQLHSIEPIIQIEHIHEHKTIIDSITEKERETYLKA